MRPASDAPDSVEAYLATGESLLARTPATLLDDSFRSAGVVGVTDRRILFVGEGGGFVDVAHDAVDSIRSRPRHGFDYRGLVPALATLAGGTLAVGSFLGVLVVDPSPLAFVLALLTVGGLAAAEGIRRVGTGGELRVLVEPTARALDRLSSVDRLREPIARARNGADPDIGDPDLLVLGVVTVALTALVGLIAASGSLLVVPLVLGTVGGAALAERGYRRERRQDAELTDRPLGRELSVHLADGDLLRLRVDPAARFDRDLSAAVRGSTTTTRTAELPSP